MKIGTLTFHAPNNNGSFLQAYALQMVLSKNGIENEIINFYTDKQEAQYSVLRYPKSFGDLIRNCISLRHYSLLKERFYRFAVMRNLYLRMSCRYRNSEDALLNIDNYDVLVCGSDQIWNTGARDFSELYLLNNVSLKKITYAVSCGSHIEDVNQNLIIDSAKKFDHISVRELTTKAFLEKSGINNVDLVLDPTLLLNKSDYAQLYSKAPIIHGDFVFLYTINYDDQVLMNAKRIADELSIPVYAAFTGYSSYKCRKYGIKVIYNMSPDVFLNMMENAKIICTNSFHGVAFSIIFEKQFYRCATVVNNERLYDDRIDSILNMLGLQKRNLDINSSINYSDIEYSTSNRILEGLKNKSVTYLINAVKE